MSSYIDIYVLPVPEKNLAAYRAMAQIGATVWKRHGALSYCEAVVDDLTASFCAPFTTIMKPLPGETIVFAYATFRSRQHRDEVNAAVMQDPELTASCDPNNMPFDPTRMVYAGFSALVEA